MDRHAQKQRQRGDEEHSSTQTDHGAERAPYEADQGEIDNVSHAPKATTGQLAENLGACS